MTVTDQTPTSDEVIAAQPPTPAGPTQRPFTVEGLVAESQGTQAAPEVASPTPPPTLDPQPVAPPPPPPPPPAPQPEAAPGTVEELPADEPGNAIALIPDSNVEAEPDLVALESWDHEVIEFMGDTLHVRKPTDQALAGWSLASSRYVKMTTRNDISGLFMARHLSPASYDRVMGRLMDPDDVEYNVDTIGKLMAAVVATRGDAA